MLTYPAWLAVENPKLVLIIGSVGLALNILSATLLHEHHGHDHGGHSHAHGHSHDLNHTQEVGHEHVHSHVSVNIETAIPSNSSSSDSTALTVSTVVSKLLMPLSTNWFSSPSVHTQSIDTPLSICGRRAVT